MSNDALYHHGILGMHWGIRRNPEQLARARGEKKSSSDDGGKTSKKSDAPATKKKSVKEMSDDELRAAIGRLELEKRYKDLSKPEEKAKSSKGKEFVYDVLEKSGKNIATQFVTYEMGTLVNKMADEEIVNPKKGQKDK